MIRAMKRSCLLNPWSHLIGHLRLMRTKSGPWLFNYIHNKTSSPFSAHRCHQSRPTESIYSQRSNNRQENGRIIKTFLFWPKICVVLTEINHGIFHLHFDMYCQLLASLWQQGYEQIGPLGEQILCNEYLFVQRAHLDEQIMCNASCLTS